MRRNVRASMKYISESISYPITRVSGVSLGAWFTLNTLTLQHNHTNRPVQGNTFMDKQCTHFTKHKQNKKAYKQCKKINDIQILLWILFVQSVLVGPENQVVQDFPENTHKYYSVHVMKTKKNTLKYTHNQITAALTQKQRNTLTSIYTDTLSWIMETLTGSPASPLAATPLPTPGGPC